MSNTNWNNRIDELVKATRGDYCNVGDMAERLKLDINMLAESLTISERLASELREALQVSTKELNDLRDMREHHRAQVHQLTTEVSDLRESLRKTSNRYEKLVDSLQVNNRELREAYDAGNPTAIAILEQ